MLTQTNKQIKLNSLYCSLFCFCLFWSIYDKILFSAVACMESMTFPLQDGDAFDASRLSEPYFRYELCRVACWDALGVSLFANQDGGEYFVQGLELKRRSGIWIWRRLWCWAAGFIHPEQSIFRSKMSKWDLSWLSVKIWRHVKAWWVFFCGLAKLANQRGFARNAKNEVYRTIYKLIGRRAFLCLVNILRKKDREKILASCLARK